MIKSRKYTAKQVEDWGWKYLKKGATLYKLEENLGVSHSTLWWYFQYKLGDIDLELHALVMTRLQYNRHLGGRRK